MADFEHIPEYDTLPESLKVAYTPKEYAWLGEIERGRLVERECYPDPEDFDD
jgi:hypothetical protein